MARSSTCRWCVPFFVLSYIKTAVLSPNKSGAFEASIVPSSLHLYQYQQYQAVALVPLTKNDAATLLEQGSHLKDGTFEDLGRLLSILHKLRISDNGQGTESDMFTVI